MPPVSTLETCECRSCGTHIPANEPVLTHFRRCYYCGRFNPASSGWRNIVIPIALIAAMTVLTAWWGQALL